MLEVEKLSLFYEGDEILKDINFNIKEGECILLTGESGSGKSSIIKSINGLATKYDEAKISGKVELFGKNINELELYQISMLVSSVFQNPKTHFFNINTTLELLFYLENTGASREEMDNRLEDMLKVFPIKHLLNRDIFKLSGGEKQILCVAASYISGARVIVLDEPSSNLDAIYIDTLAQMLKILKNKGITFIIAEHRIYYLLDIVDHVFLIKEGEISKRYAVEEFIKVEDEDLYELGLRSKTKTEIKIEKSSNSGAKIEKSSESGIKMKKNSNSGIKTEKSGNFADLEIKNLEYDFDGNGKLQISNLFLESGKVYGIIGKNGCGKSTFSRCFIGVEKKCKNEIFLNGKRLSNKERLKNSSLVMQDVNHQLFTDSVDEEIKLGTDNLNPNTADEILRELKLNEFKKRHPMSLSGGQKQRVAVASVLCKDSKFIFFDEPTSGMDYKNMVNISTLIKKLKREDNMIFIISHDNEFLNMTVDKIIDIEEYRL